MSPRVWSKNSNPSRTRCHGPLSGRRLCGWLRGLMGWYLERHDGFGPSGSSELLIEPHILGRHPFGREALIKPSPYRLPVQTGSRSDRCDRFGHAVYDDAGHAGIDHLTHRAAIKRQHRCATGHRFDHYQPERLRPIDWEQKRPRVANESDFLALIDLTDELHARGTQQRGDGLTKVRFVNAVNFSRNLQRHPDLACDLDRPIYTLFRGDPPDEGEIVAVRAERRRQQIPRQAVRYGGDEVRFGDGCPLGVGNRDERHT